MFVMYLLLVLCWFVFECYVDHGDLHVLTPSFPTRLSSDRWRRATVRATIIKRHGLPRFRPIKQHWCVEQNPTKRRARLNFTAEGSDVPLVSGISHSCGIGGLPAHRLMGRHETLINLLRMPHHRYRPPQDRKSGV